MTEISPASIALQAMNIPHKSYTHANPVRSIAQAAAERNQELSQVVRSIVFRLTDGEYALVLVAGTNQISWRSLRRHFRQSRLTLASPEEVLAITGFEVGSVSPFGLKADIPVLADVSVFRQSSVSVGSGKPGTAILMTTKNLKQALGDIELGQFAKPL